MNICRRTQNANVYSINLIRNCLPNDNHCLDRDHRRRQRQKYMIVWWELQWTFVTCANIRLHANDYNWCEISFLTFYRSTMHAWIGEWLIKLDKSWLWVQFLKFQPNLFSFIWHDSMPIWMNSFPRTTSPMAFLAHTWGIRQALAIVTILWAIRQVSPSVLVTSPQNVSGHHRHQTVSAQTR